VCVCSVFITVHCVLKHLAAPAVCNVLLTVWRAVGWLAVVLLLLLLLSVPSHACLLKAPWLHAGALSFYIFSLGPWLQLLPLFNRQILLRLLFCCQALETSVLPG